MFASPITPVDRYTRHRFHWVRKNDFEVWEWLYNGCWLRPGSTKPVHESEAAALGWDYIGEARPPAVDHLVKMATTPHEVELARAIEAFQAANAAWTAAQDRLWQVSEQGKK